MNYAVDTNVAIVANGLAIAGQPHPPTVACRLASVQFLRHVISSGMVLIDSEHEVISEYRTYLQPSGQPGVGDQFYREILNSHPERVLRVTLAKRPDGNFEDCPQELIDAGFDISDRKFVALAVAANGTIVNAVDSDWINHARQIAKCGITVQNLCGCDPNLWFE